MDVLVSRRPCRVAVRLAANQRPSVSEDGALAELPSTDDGTATSMSTSPRP
jgi:hypothetical protein